MGRCILPGKNPVPLVDVLHDVQLGTSYKYAAVVRRRTIFQLDRRTDSFSCFEEYGLDLRNDKSSPLFEYCMSPDVEEVNVEKRPIANAWMLKI